MPLPPAAQPLYEALARCHVYATGGGPLSARPNGLGPINEQTAENYEYGEFTPGADFVPGEVLPPHASDHHSVAGMSDITSDPGY